MRPAATVRFAERDVALAQLQARGARAAHALAEQGIGPGAVIAVVLRNEPSFVEALTCIRCLDAVLVLIPWHLTAAELRPIVQALNPALFIVHADLVERVYQSTAGATPARIAVVATPPKLLAALGLPAPPPLPSGTGLIHWEALIDAAGAALPIPARSIQAIAITSGSSGRPKIIRRQGRARWIRWAMHCTRAWPQIHRSIVTAPLYHTGQYGVFSQACHLGADQLIMPRFDAETFLREVERWRINHAYLSPPMFVQLLRLPASVRARYDVSSLDYVVQTGAPCAAQIKQQMLDWLGPVIWEVYGCSETSTIAACSSEEWRARPGTVGRPLRRVLIVDEHGVPCPPGRTGEIYLDVSDMPGIRYQNAELKQCRVDGVQFISVGDRGALDDEGYLFVRGRVDEVINNGRLKVYPQEIENAILRHPAVHDCVVFAIPDAVYGQAVAAAVRTARDHPAIEAELQTFLRGQLSEHKIPVRIWAQTGPLRTDAGKINRQRLAQRALAAVAPG